MYVKRVDMARRPGLSKAELQIAQVLWKLGEGRVRDVVEALGSGRKLDFSTVQTYLRRLKAKGYLRTRRDGRADIYIPAVRSGHVVRDVVRDFIDRVFGGEALPLVQHLIEDRGLSDEEIRQLQAALDQLKRRRSK